MPDRRQHRGAHPEDAALFARERWPVLRQAASELCWLLDRGYAMRSSLALVGNRHALTERQRLALVRSACSAVDRDRRSAHLVACGDLSGAELWIDAYNLIISVESALSGAVILAGRDRCFRDLASLHGTYRTVSETIPALESIGRVLSEAGAARCLWVIDRPVSNSGRLKGMIESSAALHGWTWEARLEFSPDAVLSTADAVVATSDSVILDRCGRWTNLAREVIERNAPAATVIDLGEPF